MQLTWDPAHTDASVAVDGAAASHNRNTWDRVQCGTWLSSGVHRITVSTDNVDNCALFLGVVSRQYWAPDAEDEPSAKRAKTDDNEEGEIEAPAPAPACQALPRRWQHRDCSH